MADNRAVAVLFLVILAPACTAPRGAPTSMRGATGAAFADQLMARYADAWTTDDFATMSDMLADDVIYFDANNQSRVGRDAVGSYFHNAMRRTTRMAITTIRSGAAGDRAYHVGHWTVNPGESTEDRGVYSFIFRLDPDGTWRIASAHVEDIDAPAGRNQ